MIPMRRFFLTCILILVASLAFAQQTPEEQLAMQYYKDGEYEKASELFDKIQLTKKNAYLYYYNFQTLYELHDLDKLEKLAKKQCKLSGNIIILDFFQLFICPRKKNTFYQCVALTAAYRLLLFEFGVFSIRFLHCFF